MSQEPDISLLCPVPQQHYEHIVMAHGGGGMLMRQLLDGIIRPALDNPFLRQRHDSVAIPLSGRYALTTDSYVVKPLFFPGGDIGKLAVCGTLNDLAMAGAKPLYLTVSLVMEEGLSLTTLQAIMESMAVAAKQAGVSIVTGDTKVVERGKGDGLYICTTGVGLIPEHISIHPTRIQAGDVIISNGDIGRHGVAIMASRENLELESTIESDCADLSGLVSCLIESGIDIHCMRDLTRGGLGAALIELAEESGHECLLDEIAITISEDVTGVCELLGLDPLYVANEGRFLMMVPASQIESCLNLLRAHPLGTQAGVIGQVTASGRPHVSLKTSLGSMRRLHLPSGEQLPRIC